MDLSRVFVSNMKKYRKMTGISQDKLAELCEASSSHIRQIECGAKYPSFVFIDRLAAALRVPAALLFTDDTEEKAYITLNSRQIETELIDSLARSVHAAFAKL